MPFVISNIYYDISKTNWTVSTAKAVYFLMTLNCMIDPIIYNFAGHLLQLISPQGRRRLSRTISINSQKHALTSGLPNCVSRLRKSIISSSDEKLVNIVVKDAEVDGGD